MRCVTQYEINRFWKLPISYQIFTYVYLKETAISLSDWSTFINAKDFSAHTWGTASHKMH